MANSNRRFGASAITAAVLTVIIAMAAFTLSFYAIAHLARLTGVFPEPLTWLLPIIVDVFIVQATFSLVTATAANNSSGKRYHWTMLAGFALLSVAVNAYHALVTAHGPLPPAVSAGIAIIPPLAWGARTPGLLGPRGGPRPARARAPLLHVQPTADAGREREDAAGGSSQPAASQLPNQHDNPESGPDGTSGSRPTVSDDDLRVARLVHSATRSTKPVHDIAVALAYSRYGLTPAAIETALDNTVHRTTISRWLTTARGYTENRAKDLNNVDLVVQLPALT